MEDKFFEWCSGYVFAIGWDRYGSLSNWEFIAIAADNNESFKSKSYTNKIDLNDLAPDLELGDQVALDAADTIREQVKFIGINKDPSKALSECLTKLRKYYDSI